MVSKKSFKLLVVSRTTPFFEVVQIIYFLDYGSKVLHFFGASCDLTPLALCTLLSSAEIKACPDGRNFIGV